jgi:endonuclease YncB( thermonuclease family)
MRLDLRECRGHAMARTPRIRCILASLGIFVIAVSAATSASAAGCSFEPQGEGRIAAIIDARTFRMEDGREVRLAGIEAASGGAAALAALVGRPVALHGETDMPDRYGRQPAFAFVDRAARPLQRMLLEQGEALASGAVADKACAAELAEAEAVARQANRGLWAQRAAIKNAESGDDILTRIGLFTVVEGKVLSVRQAGAVTYINFGRRWTRDFAATIPRRAMAAIEAAGISVKALENKRIRVRGFVESRQGPRIELLRVGQIEMAGPI